MKMLGTVAVGVVRESRKFSGHPYIGRIARSAFLFSAEDRLSVGLPPFKLNSGWLPEPIKVVR